MDYTYNSLVTEQCVQSHRECQGFFAHGNR